MGRAPKGNSLEHPPECGSPRLQLVPVDGMRYYCSVNLGELDRELVSAVALFPSRVRRELVRIVDLPEKERIAEIGALYRSVRWSFLAELLIDLEEDERVRRVVVAELRCQTRG
jgi:hypothetical protein